MSPELLAQRLTFQLAHRLRHDRHPPLLRPLPRSIHDIPSFPRIDSSHLHLLPQALPHPFQQQFVQRRVDVRTRMPVPKDKRVDRRRVRIDRRRGLPLGVRSAREGEGDWRAGGDGGPEWGGRGRRRQERVHAHEGHGPRHGPPSLSDVEVRHDNRRVPGLARPCHLAHAPVDEGFDEAGFAGAALADDHDAGTGDLVVGEREGPVGV